MRDVIYNEFLVGFDDGNTSTRLLSITNPGRDFVSDSRQLHLLFALLRNLKKHTVCVANVRVREGEDHGFQICFHNNLSVGM